MAKRLNRLLAALAATATLATGITASAWAGTANGKVPLDVKATDGTTLDGSTINLYKVGEYDSPQYDKDGQLAGIHATSTDADDRTGFTVGKDGTRTTIKPHGKAAKAAATAGVTVSDDTDPLDAVWRLDTADTRITAFAQAYAKELADAKATPDETTAGAATTRVKPGLYVAIRGTDTNTAMLAATSDADGRTISGRNMGSVSLTGTTTTRDDAKDDSLLDKAKTAVKGLLGLSDAAQTPTDSDTEVPKLAGKLTVAEAKGTDASDVTTRIWRIGDLGDATNTVVKGLEDGTLTEKAAIKRLDSLTGSTPVASVKGTGLVQTGAGWFLTDSDGTRHVTAVGSDRTGNSLYDGEVFAEGPKRSEAETESLDQTGKSGISLFSSKARSARAANNTISVGEKVTVNGTDNYTHIFIWHTDQGDREAFCAQPQAYSPVDGSTVRVAEQSTDPEVWRAYFFYGVGGPADWFKKNGVSAADGRAIMHIQLARLRAAQTGDPSSSYDTMLSKYPKGEAWVKFCESHLIKNKYANDWNGDRWFITTYELTAQGSQNAGKQLLISSKVERAYDLNVTTSAEMDYDGDGRETDQARLRDILQVTTKNGRWPADGSKIRITAKLVYDPTPDGIDADGGRQANNESDRKTVTKTNDWSPTGGMVKDQTAPVGTQWFSPSDMFGEGKGWQYGRYWFDITVSRVSGNSHMNKDSYSHTGYKDGSESFNRTYVTGSTAAMAKDGSSWKAMASAMDSMLGSDTAVKDYVDLSGTYPRYKADSSNGGQRQTFLVKQTLHYRSAAGAERTSAVKSFAYAYDETTPSKTGQKSSEFTPSDLNMKDGWEAGSYWFDNVIEGRLTENSPLTPGTAGYEKNTEKLSDGSVVRTWHSHGESEENEHWTIASTTPSIGTKAVASGATAGGAQPVHDSITVTNPDPNRAVTLAKVTTTLHVKGTGAKASKTVTGKTVPAGGSLTFDSATFTPSDLGDKTWKAGVTYWFDATVKASDASYPSGAQALTADLNHDGSNDAAQQFKLTMDADFSTKAQDTFTQAGGTGAVHDRLLLKSGSDALTADLDVRVTLNWNASPTGTAGTKSLTKAGVFKAGAASSDLPDFTPSDFGWTSWKGGRYWYDVTIPAQNGISSTTLKGLQKDVAAESWTAAVPWTLDLAKLAYIGQPGSGRWDNEPVKGATFTLTETTDRTGDTAVSGAKTLTVTTDRNGRAHLTDGTIATDGVKWFKLVETQAPSSYKTPDAGTFWMVKVTGSADGATVTVTGSDKTAQALLKSVDGSTLTVGDQFQGNIMPPLTGGTYDVMRGLALAGGIMLAMLAGGVLWTRRRTDARHAR